jgi:hypothetical protein
MTESDVTEELRKARQVTHNPCDCHTRNPCYEARPYTAGPKKHLDDCRDNQKLAMFKLFKIYQKEYVSFQNAATNKRARPS